MLCVTGFWCIPSWFVRVHQHGACPSGTGKGTRVTGLTPRSLVPGPGVLSTPGTTLL